MFILGGTYLRKNCIKMPAGYVDHQTVIIIVGLYQCLWHQSWGDNTKLPIDYVITQRATLCHNDITLLKPYPLISIGII